MIRFAFGAKWGSPGSAGVPPARFFSPPNAASVLGSRLPNAITPSPRAALEKKWRRLIASGSRIALSFTGGEGRGEEVSFIWSLRFGAFLELGCWNLEFSVSSSFPNRCVQIHYGLRDCGHGRELNRVQVF